MAGDNVVLLSISFHKELQHCYKSEYISIIKAFTTTHSQEIHSKEKR